MPATTTTDTPPLTDFQLTEVRAVYASLAIEGTSLSETEFLDIAREFYASGVPERIVAMPTHPDITYEEFITEFRRAGLLKG